MKQTILLISTIAILYACGPSESKTELKNKAGTLKNSLNDQIKKPISYNRECSYDNEVASLGLGLVIAPSKFEIYNDSLLSEKLASRDMYSENDSIKEICSKFFMPEYGMMHFICTGQTEKAYRVLINYSQVEYLPKDKGYKFESWEQYITSSFGIRRNISNEKAINLQSEPLHRQPHDNSDTLSVPKGYEMFCPIQVNGDWVKVAYDCFYNLNENEHEGEPCHKYIGQCKSPLTGWLRWRRDNKILIDIMLMP